jgi:hypothetical protein
MTFDAAEKIFRDIEPESESDKLLRDLFDELTRLAVRYARLRTDWQLSSVEARAELDDQRARAHDALLDSCNILSRAMLTKGNSVNWRAKLGQERGEIGDFACHFHALLGVMAR